MPTAKDQLEGIAAARPRLAHVAAKLGMRVPDDAEYVVSWSNDTWLCGDVVVRICFRGDRARLTREAAIGAALPDELRYPRVLAAGHDDDLSWMVVARVDGQSLWERWQSMSAKQLRPLITQLADAMRALHSWAPPSDVRALLDAHDAPAPTGSSSALVGHDLLALPSPRWKPLVEAALELPFVDAGVVRAVAARIDELTPHDPFGDGREPVVVHGDVNFANALWRDGELAALLDYEWSRLGPRDAELVSFIRAAGNWRADPRDVPPVVRWLGEDYPELVAAPDTRERVWITQLVYSLRHLVVWPPDGPAETQEPEHPVHVLPRLVDAPWAY